jgi:hypothetical protein
MFVRLKRCDFPETQQCHYTMCQLMGECLHKVTVLADEVVKYSKAYDTNTNPLVTADNVQETSNYVPSLIN